jgi:aldehyde dehydrogenase (NAD(P)+)
VVKIDFSDPAYFLQAAVAFANNELDGSLGANVIAHPQTMREYRPHFDQAIANLKYGAIAINTWTALNFLIPRASWGAYPGNSVESAGSGVGVVHNALLFDRPEKTVARGPFSPMPRGWRQGEFHASPPPPWSLTAANGAEVARLFTRFVADPKPSRLPPLLRQALAGQ